MSTFRINKIIGASLAAVMLITIVHLIGNAIFEPEHLATTAMVVESAAEEQQATKAGEAEPQPLGVLLDTAQVDAGKKMARKCAACHSFDQGGKNKVGPNLWGILGTDRAKVAGYNYSSAMTDAGGQWGYKELDHFLADPKGAINGTKMTFAGVKKGGDRAAVIVYLRSLSESPLPLPPAE